ncbi:MAG: hypothetical protein GY711_05560 [bacterium]|nr:hypothetical protein [bacterium]
MKRLTRFALAGLHLSLPAVAQNARLVPIDTAPGAIGGTARGTNADGTVVTGSMHIPITGNRPFVWTPAEGASFIDVPGMSSTTPTPGK